MRSAFASLPCAALVLLSASTAMAGVGSFTAFDDQAEWEAAVAALSLTPTVETFDGIEIPDLQPSSGLTAINGDFGITVTGVDDAVGVANISGGLFEGEIFPATGHTGYVHSFNTPIQAFGQNYLGAASGLGLVISTTEGDVDIFDFFTVGTFDDGFLGFVSTTPVSAVSIVGSDNDGGTALGEIYDADDVQYALVPEPASLGLLGQGGLALIRRRR